MGTGRYGSEGLRGMRRRRRILPDLRSGAQKCYYREIRSPIDINNAPGDSSRISQGPEIDRDPPPPRLYFNHWVAPKIFALGPAIVSYGNAWD